ncbi:hypothetical protein AKJ52_01185 [candidate division MSBL1 archaeon SCGC-AAA382C18]|uniref:Sulfatase N-terminal domain-containing protein n=1 Tax=candidate division MSBL1 archaeon SCGC-AAA382C18 TaxID=1698281 RepID=A0A133VKM9_9EURY|nr:hypothetical protein AKJ52_01185 [candidate division MSBL1 archaeon SCGC-AAA382C18]
MMNGMKQKKLIKKKDWKYLIICDACRYDYFKKMYTDYLSGKLKKVLSPGSRTPEWLQRTFKGKKHDDIVYISPLPGINSKQIETETFQAVDFFHKIIDVWDWGWDEQSATVPPENINKAAIEEIESANNKRLVIHYLQPHAPYLGYDHEGGKVSAGKIRRKVKEETVINNVLNWISDKIAEPIFSKCPEWYLIKWRLGYELDILSHERPIIRAKRQSDNKKVSLFYKENLKKVLDACRNLINSIPISEDKKAIVTSDHGELLGEGGFYGHYPKSNHPILREVPWLEVTE